MSPRQLIVTALISIFMLVLIIRLVQKGKLDIAYCWLWLGVGFCMLAVVVWYDLLVTLTNFIGAVLPTTTLFLLSIMFIFLMCLQFSIAISRHRRELTKLTQQVALLSQEKGCPPSREESLND